MAVGIPTEFGDTVFSSGELPSLRKIERAVIENRLKLFKGNISVVARSLGLSRATIHNRLKAWKRAQGEGQP